MRTTTDAVYEKLHEEKAVLEDHRDIAKGIGSSNLEKAQGTIRKHLSRLDETIEFIFETYPNYFE